MYIVWHPSHLLDTHVIRGPADVFTTLSLSLSHHPPCHEQVPEGRARSYVATSVRTVPYTYIYVLTSTINDEYSQVRSAGRGRWGEGRRAAAKTAARAQRPPPCQPRPPSGATPPRRSARRTARPPRTARSCPSAPCAATESRSGQALSAGAVGRGCWRAAVTPHPPPPPADRTNPLVLRQHHFLNKMWRIRGGRKSWDRNKVKSRGAGNHTGLVWSWPRIRVNDSENFKHKGLYNFITNAVEIVLSFIKSVNHLFRLNKKRKSFIVNAKMTN